MNGARRALPVVFYTWLGVVPVLIGVGLTRRVVTPSRPVSIDDAVSYAATTDTFLMTGLMLNGVLPFAVAILGWTERRRLVIVAAVGAALIYGVVAMAGIMSDAPLFGHWPRIEKP